MFETENRISRLELARWTGWFFVANILLFFVIGLNYIPLLLQVDSIPLASDSGLMLAWIFTFLAFIGQFSLIAFIGCAITFVFVFLLARRWFAFVVGILIAAALCFFLIADAVAYHLSHFHLAGLIWQIIRSGTASEIIVLSHFEWILIAIIAATCLVGEYFLARFVWRRLKSASALQFGRYVALILATCLLVSYIIYALVALRSSNLDATTLSNDQLVMLDAKIVPYYNVFLRYVLPKKYLEKRVAELNQAFYDNNADVNKLLRYPLHPLTFNKPAQFKNIVIIAIDTWRFDMLNSKVTPNIAKFSKQAIRFTDNYSGGNSTRPGIFSLFYSLPPTYWHAMLHNHLGPVLIDQLLQDHYQMGIFASASLDFPQFDKTVFSQINNLQVDTPGNNSAQRDRKITQEFKQFINSRNHQKPFFSFLFYDSAHNFCGNNSSYAQIFQPAVKACDRLALIDGTNPVPYINRYKNSLHFVDSLVAKDLSVLKAQGLLKNTIVIITADHGEEFNDEKLGYWGHASAFDPYQIKTPLVVYWPSNKPHLIHYQTSHYDIVPTLMKKALGCMSPTLDYSIGHSLFQSKHRKFLIVGSYSDYAILQQNKITTIMSGGDYQITNANEHPLANSKLNHKVLGKVFRLLNLYYV